MGNPRTPRATDSALNLANGALHECQSAISSLNMEPAPVEDPSGRGWLADTDDWARHARSHMRAAVSYVSALAQKLDVIQDICFHAIKQEQSPEEIYHRVADVLNVARVAPSGQEGSDDDSKEEGEETGD
jgi:hypothetical protein